MARNTSVVGRHRKPERPAPPTPDLVIAGLAVAGLVVSLYLTATKLAGTTAVFCEAGTACDVVQASRYSTFLGVPTAAWGAAVYVVIAALALRGLSAGRWLLTFAIASGAVAFSGYLTFLELFVIHAICPYCVAVALIALALFLALLWRRPTSPRKTVSPVRVATVAVVVAAVTVVGAIEVYVSSTPTEQAEFQDGLARHLASTGSTMYGAYW